ncbi:MAG: hypothetical protein DMF51_07555 [Acidobacteria bacterium]|nr:MAG: hypothetical protein DMF51_07555 [Acidobacteriota bacterium]
MRYREPLSVIATTLAVTIAFTQSGPAEAPAGFDDQTNGFVNQTQFDSDRTIFEERETIDDGLGPVYNAQACAECHQNPVTGGISQVTELRAGHFDGLLFVNHPGGSLINDRAIDPSIQERVLGGNEVRTFRTSLNVLGDGFVECIDSNTLVAISNRQPAGMRGQFIQVPVVEANNQIRGGRFGWKNQHASLLSFAADAYLNEMGITSPLQPNENTSNGTSVAAFDKVPDPDNDGADVEAFARFMRATKAPPRDETLAATASAQRGDQLFTLIGCDVCHLRTITTAPAGTVINQGAFIVPAALGGKTIHPFGDFLLHNIGTGDGIVQNGGPSTRNKVRTAPLWGLRTRDRLMHDGTSLTRNEAILRHAGEAGPVIFNYRNLAAADKDALITFLNSL